MPSIQIKNVPDPVHAELRRRAEKEGRSLQEYMLALLTKETRHPPIGELLERAALRGGTTLSAGEAARLIREDRDSR